MAMNIPMPGLPGEALMQGLNVGSGLFSRYMEPVLQRQRMAQQNQQFGTNISQRQAEQAQAQENFLQNLALRKQAEARMAQNAGLQREMHALQMQQLRDELDPSRKLAKIQQLMNGINGMYNHVEPQQHPIIKPMEGQGMPSMEEMNPFESNSNKMGLSNEQMRDMALQMAGIRVPKQTETPEQKRFAELRDKMQLEEFKTKIKNQALNDKEIKSVQKDLPTLEKSLKGVDELMRIAKNNPSMFGHGFMPDRFAKTTNIKDFGRWQNLISDAIAGLEQKLSSRGNIVALKMAAQLKPSHAEQQNVALGKLESMREQLVDSINNSRKALGKELIPKEEKQNINDIDLSQLSDEELMKIASGGQ